MVELELPESLLGPAPPPPILRLVNRRWISGQWVLSRAQGSMNRPVLSSRVSACLDFFRVSEGRRRSPRRERLLSLLVLPAPAILNFLDLGPRASPRNQERVFMFLERVFSGI